MCIRQALEIPTRPPLRTWLVPRPLILLFRCISLFGQGALTLAKRLLEFMATVFVLPTTVALVANAVLGARVRVRSLFRSDTLTPLYPLAHPPNMSQALPAEIFCNINPKKGKGAANPAPSQHQT